MLVGAPVLLRIVAAVRAPRPVVAVAAVLPLRFRGGVEIAAQGMLSLPWLSLVLSRKRDPLVRDAMHAHASAGSARLLVP